jgi:hypothetical protein
LIWIPDEGSTLRLDLPAWRKFFGFDKNGAYAELSIDINLDALTMDWSSSGAVPLLPTAPHFQRDILGRAAGAKRTAGPFARWPDGSSRVGIDPRRRAE